MIPEIVFHIAYLASCAINNQIPDAERVHQINLPELYRLSERHLLTGIIAMALESAGVKDSAFTQAKGKAIRKVAAFDIEREAVLHKLEEAKIWYMPLKGSVLKDVYPKIGMRQMADNDILYDVSRCKDVRTIMESLGFETVSFVSDVYHHDQYNKEPVCNFEMHRALFLPGLNDRIFKYYQHIEDKMIPNSGSHYGYHFSDEDFYIYMIAHEYKHYIKGGTGIRSLLDTFVYVKEKSDSMDWRYIEGELKKMDLQDFEEQNRNLAMHLFGLEELSQTDEEMLEYMLSSGTYGNMGNRVENRIKKYGDKSFRKIRYVFRRIFLSPKIIKAFFPVFYKYPILLPFLPFYRIYKSLTLRGGRMMNEIKELAAYKKKQ